MVACCAALVRRAVRDEDATLESKVAWPLTSFGTGLLAGQIVLATVGVVVGALVCNQSETCSGRAWDEDVWGERYENEHSCERFDADGFMQERANTLSNVFFFVCGFIIVGCGVADAVRERTLFPLFFNKDSDGTPCFRSNNMMDFPVMSLSIGLAIVAQGIFSFMFHAHATSLTKSLDLGILSLILALNAAAATMLCCAPDSPRLAYYRIGVLGFFSVLGGALVLFKGRTSSSAVLLLLVVYSVVCVAWSVLRRGVAWRHTAALMFFCVPRQLHTHVYFERISLMAASVFIFGTAFVMRFWDDAKNNCDPDSPFQFHSAWHALSAAALLCEYLFFRSERTVKLHHNGEQVKVGPGNGGPIAAML